MSRGPAALRPVVMALHWTALIAMVAWLFGALPGWALALHALGWGTITAVFGLRGGPSPALKGALRRVAHLAHAVLLALYGLAALATALDLAAARALVLATLAAAALHAVFNLWRASVLGDGALRRITPKVLH
ncbi:hypothetical protein [uncultured Jannaschia sp.]|uniref:hypothetical protein n=1 Tax=uncultured Jannaschia sp. TaxID=293347 RepID=UPI002633AE31|nr:hypothetical protein [uncultured Jannaschia sp.]